jgi:hypothetical protein
MLDRVFESMWMGPMLWASLSICDYLLTISCARMYRAQDKIVFEGSYELTPHFQADVDALRRISPHFLLVLAASTGCVLLVRLIAYLSPALSQLYVVVLGAMVLIQATVHVRHLRNWFIFREGTSVIQGRMAYPRGLLLRMSAFELLLFAGLYFGLFLVTTSLFVLGGAIAAAALALNHFQLARRHVPGQASAA